MNIIELIDIKTEPDRIHTYNAIPEETPLIIDNGSYKCRVGWNTCEQPLLTFRNVIAKPRKDRKKDRVEICSTAGYQVGNDIANIEAVRAQLKSQFERNIVTQFNTQEEILDYIFEHLNINSDGHVPHPVLLTEAIGNPNFCRQRMNELLFETYGIRSLSYGIDSLFSWNFNKTLKDEEDCLIISFGYHTTHVIPVLNNQLQYGSIRRLNIGGYHIITYLYRLMQMKYPVHINAITVSRMETLLQQYGFVAKDYQEDLKKWAHMDFYDNNVRKIQLPYNAPVPTSNLGAEQKLERRKELTRRLLEANARRAREKINEDKNELMDLCQIRAEFELGNIEFFESQLQAKNISNLDNLDVSIKEIRQRIEKLEKRANAQVENVPAAPKETSNAAENNPPRDISIEKWVSLTNAKRDEILKKKNTRRLRRQDLAKRKTAAAQERMRIISQLARNDKGTDEFGMNDDDWDVYKAISRDDSESETENEQLLECENILRKHDPNFEEPIVLSSNFTAEHYQLHIGVETMRCPEILFQPSMVGNFEAGLSEVIEFVLKLFKPAEQQRLANNIFLTGGCAQFPGIKERLSKDLTASRPFQSTHNISIAKGPDLDAWFGAREYTKSDTFKETLSTKEDYLEKGFEYLMEHRLSNKYFNTPSQES